MSWTMYALTVIRKLQLLRAIWTVDSKKHAGGCSSLLRTDKNKNEEVAAHYLKILKI